MIAEQYTGKLRKGVSPLPMNRQTLILYSAETLPSGEVVIKSPSITIQHMYLCSLSLSSYFVLVVEEQYRFLCCDQPRLNWCYICLIPGAGQWLLGSLFGANMYLRPRPFRTSRRERELRNDSSSRICPLGGRSSPSYYSQCAQLHQPS
jgi:hypothetical protein